MPQLRAMRTLPERRKVALRIAAWRDRASRRPDARPTPRSAPPDHVTQRLAENLQRRTSKYRTDATIDLTMIDALLEHRGPEAAREALDDHASSLDALLADLHAAVAEAAVERDVVDSSPQVLDARHGGLVARVRDHAVAAASASALLLALVLPGPRPADPDTLFAGDGQVVADNVPVLRARSLSARKAASAAAATVRSAGTRLLGTGERVAESAAIRSAAAAAQRSGRIAAIATFSAGERDGDSGRMSPPSRQGPATTSDGPTAATPPADAPLVPDVDDIPAVSAPDATPGAPSPDAAGAKGTVEGQVPSDTGTDADPDADASADSPVAN